MVADIGQQQGSCTFFRLSDRTLISRVRDYCDLTGISEIPGGSQTLVATWIWAISWHDRPV
jgi:hypothetical protein